ncbi:PREDICTED: uncharacterized protein LOC108775825, partial [Cyphomyrmex costatus]|uniref:uncharacterized protein LOC108775825 n=1 Tax=Cyphomyrmex costatus TaxID=456900 RepID=UPI0008521F71
QPKQHLTTVTYGLACAPFLALRTIQQLIKDEGSRFPLASPCLQKGRYVDDLFGGADNLETTKDVVNELIELCMAGGFKLRKWSTNHPEILSSIPKEDQIPSVSIDRDNNPIVQALGLQWQPIDDVFQFTFICQNEGEITKRKALSTLAKFFDPLGFLSPIIIIAKILIQELWAIKLGWDDPLPCHFTSRWHNFIKNLQDTPQITIPRWIGFSGENRIEVHGFSDASKKAMAAVVYVRITTPEGSISANFVASKTKVAPLKRLTIPRLELCGAVLLTKLVFHLLTVLDLKNQPIVMWTDSLITYTWLNNHPSRWKEFVYNRVSFIQESLPQAEWKFVPGHENPADAATRGLIPSQLLNDTCWWNGPTWLSQSTTMWPQRPAPHSQEKDLEEHTIKVHAVVIKPKSEWDLLSRYSNLTKLYRITATCQRAISRFRRVPPSAFMPTLTTQELETARNFWVKTTQRMFFSNEIQSLSNGQPISRSSHIVRLTPFLDASGLLRVGGRLQQSHLFETEKHPLILPKESALTPLIISHAHNQTLHGGTQVTLSYIRKEYWLIGGRAPVRSWILKCMKCTRFRQKRAQQLMGQLPTERVTPSRPFTHSGIDYAGPFIIKTWKGKNARSYKAYVALFVCFSTSAVHLELVTDYSADAFIAAYKRFSARRGICTTLSSDCGTTLTGANSELQRLFNQVTQESTKLARLLANNGTQWKFNPPSAPHFGGKWEAGIKSLKYHLVRIVGNTLLTYEEMNTLLTQIEAVLNSRPLCPLTEDPDDLQTLTPGHFLMGCAPVTIPEPSLELAKVTHLSRWQLITQMLQSFWTKWSTECLQRYYAIYKWNKPAPSLSVGMLVLIIDERYPPSKWPLGRIIETHPGKDGYIRVVTVKTQVSVLKRPIAKICPLPVNQETL